MERRIFLITDKSDATVLRQKTAPFDFSKYTKKEIRELTRDMRIAMKRADGVGLSANQIGLNASLFIAQAGRKCHAIFNPEVIKVSRDEDEMEEGCLSIPGKFGVVRRPVKIAIRCQNADGKKERLEAWGFLARVFQHEMDHLNGVLFIDKALEVYDAPRAALEREKVVRE